MGSVFDAVAGQLVSRAVKSRVRGAGGNIAADLARGLATGSPGAINQAIRAGAMGLQDAAVARLSKVNGAAGDVLGAILADIRRGGYASPEQVVAAPMWGGLTVEQAKALHTEMMRHQLARKNLFHVSIEDRNPPPDAIEAVGLFNLFAIDTTFSRYTMPGEAVPLGSANMDRLAATERVELRMTVMDDEAGRIKRWFAGKCAQQASRDGTFGLPADYVIRLTVRHMDVAAEGLRGQFLQSFLVRCASIETELSRRDQAMEELALSFTEFDTFL